MIRTGKLKMIRSLKKIKSLNRRTSGARHSGVCPFRSLRADSECGQGPGGAPGLVPGGDCGAGGHLRLRPDSLTCWWGRIDVMCAHAGIAEPLALLDMR